MKSLALAALIVLAPAAALSQETPEAEASLEREFESSRNGFFEVNGTKYAPDVSTTTPYREVFGSKKLWLFELESDLQLWRGFGTLSVGIAAGYGAVWGNSIVVSTSTRGVDTTALKTVPVRGLLVYRFDWLSRELGIPLVPFAKGGIAETIWWITDGAGNFARFAGKRALGIKHGYEVAGGLALELDFLDATLARDLDRDAGVNSTFVQAQYVVLGADSFGGNGLDLSTRMWLFGAGFEY